MPADAKRKAARAQRYGRTVDHTVGATSNETQPESDQVAAGLQQLDTSESSEDDNSEEAPSDNEGGPAQTTIGTSTHSNSKSREPPRRYICFVGNLPFSATEATLKQHFRSARPTAVRLRTDKATGRSRGFAFLEFGSPDAMQACLRRFHHSRFPDEDTMPKKAPSGEADAGVETREDGDGDGKEGATGRKDSGRGWRKINVELTVGGGGHHSEGRKVRLKAKNDRLHKQRIRRAAALAEKEGAKEGIGDAKEAGEKSGATSQGNVHPSRMKRVKA